MIASTQLKSIELRHPIISKIKFALLLPAAELLLCAALVWPIRLIIFHALGIPLPHLVEETMIPDYFRWASKQHSFLGCITALNIPALVVQLPYVIASDAKTEWTPAGMDLHIWRGVTYPWICLPFWWIAGRAIDALKVIKHNRVVPRIRWIEVVIGFLWVAGGVTLFIGFLVSPSSDKDADLTRFAASGGLWALLGSLSVIAWFRQWRLRKKKTANG